MTCPGCREEMAEQRLDALYGKTVVLDVCHACNGLWFDGHESLQLTPGSTLRLFRLIHEKAADRRPRPAGSLSCPHCQAALVATSDMVRNTPFSYDRCPRGHGRFTTFFQFLREKSFVRPLDPQQLAELRQVVRMISCSNCGGPVNLEKGSACPYCRAPVSMLDPKRLEATLQELRAAEEKRQNIDPARVAAEILIDRLKVESIYARHGSSRRLDGPAALGLVEAGLGALVKALKTVL